MCKIAEIVVVGGVRRSALISCRNLSDDRMRHAKAGQWWNDYGHTRTRKQQLQHILRNLISVSLWTSGRHSTTPRSGERGIFNRQSANMMAEKSGRREVGDHEFGTNPCSEIILRSREFCNLSEVVVRAGDTRESLLEKVRLATILGTFQSSLVNFKYISKRWKKNCEEERLLGVSMTGIMDNKYTNGKIGDLPSLLEELKAEAVKVNAEMSKKLGINQSSCYHLCQTIRYGLTVS